ncbi:hypothetical protein BDQ12DRAFT_708162 [Crucibulum laeve]|uniref:DUF6535 domain-containing protein n=1 Tax=Crucibulum laeve TaxID=68775 RepID=A0A5C3MJT7_9AGAR|nr:hypothetical protein BDQ12DRAFT_708162 [Crucibulum laeve]
MIQPEVPKQPSPPGNSATTSHNVHTVDNTRQVNEEPEFVPWRSGDPFRYPIPKDGDPWETCYKPVKKYDDVMCTAWKDEVQNLLIFAGLFSAVVTAFVVESYKMLTDPIDDSTRLLAQIAAELASINGRNTTTTIPLPQEKFSPSALAIRLNTFWFLSLTLSLATVLVGILALQWIREYERYETTSYKERLHIRQMRYEGIAKWQVPNILRGLPVLLQLALILFFLGMLDLLRSLDFATTVILSIVVGLVFLIILTTTMIPGIQLLFMQHSPSVLVDSQSWSICPYKSPQSWAFSQLVISSTYYLVSFSYELKPLSLRARVQSNVLSRLHSVYSWYYFDNSQNELRTYKYLPNAITWAGRKFGQGNDSIPSAIYHCINEMSPSTARRTVTLLSDFHVEKKAIEGNALHTDVISAKCLARLRNSYFMFSQQSSIHEMELFVRIINSKTQNEDDIFSSPYLFKVIREYATDSTKYPSELMLQVIHGLVTIFESQNKYSSRSLCVAGGFVWYGIVASDTINGALHMPLAKLYRVLHQCICLPQLEPANCDASRDFSPLDPRYRLFCSIMSYALAVPSPVVPPNLDRHFYFQQHCKMLRALEVLFRSAFVKYSKYYFSRHSWATEYWPAFRDKTLLVTLPSILDDLEDVVVDN